MTEHDLSPESATPDAASLDGPAAEPGQYTVVARRYRPQTFDELIGQGHVARALSQAITTDRVGHAYLFTGARGVGKTSAARVLAKALNCEAGPSPTPCNACDICQSIAGGDDIDVLEIDGASNRGIDEIRQLRQNVAVRPSRSRSKIYIIDEVHMLTKEAFNALLKTLEEPPEHVKFIFATTEPNKIPITILSRCQRFDFAGIDAPSIQHRLVQIAEAEGAKIEPAAVQIIAARAAGSMRDSQSLLEQLLAVAGGVITADDVNTLLGIAPAERLSQLVEHLVDRNAAAALAELDSTLAGGVEVGLLLDQLVGYFRDVMAAGVGCSGELMLYALPSQSEAVAGVANRLGVHTVLAVLQILDQSAARMRVSMHSRTLVEMAVVRICNLEDLDDLAALVAELRDGDDQALPSVRRPAARNTAGPSAPPQVAPPPVAVETVAQIGAAAEERVAAESPPSIVSELSPGEARKLWEKITSEVGGLVSEYGTMTDDVSATPQGELVVRFGQQGAMAGAHCQRPDLQRQLQRVAEGLCGPGVSLRFEMPHASQPSGAVAPPAPRATKRQLEAEVAEQPFVKKALTLFDVQQGQFQFTAGDDDRPPT